MDSYIYRILVKYVLLPFTFIALLFVYNSAFAKPPEDIDNQIRDISTYLMCPVCSGQSVAESNAQLAKDMRDAIRQQLSQGKSKDQILDYFVDRYGETILSSPPPKGFNILIWILPTFGIILIGFLLGNYLYKSRSSNGVITQNRNTQAKFKKIEDDLDNYDF